MKSVRSGEKKLRIITVRKGDFVLDFFDTIINYIEIIWNFFVNLISSIISLVTALLSAMIIPQTVHAWVFGPLGASVLAVMGIAGLKLIIGRDNG